MGCPSPPPCRTSPPALRPAQAAPACAPQNLRGSDTPPASPAPAASSCICADTSLPLAAAPVRCRAAAAPLPSYSALTRWSASGTPRNPASNPEASANSPFPRCDNAPHSSARALAAPPHPFPAASDSRPTATAPPTACRSTPTPSDTTQLLLHSAG